MKLSLSLSAVFPLFCYLVIGFVCKKLGIVDKQATSKFNTLLFQILFPINLFKNVVDARQALLNGEGTATIIYLLAYFAVMLVLLIFVAKAMSKDKKRQGAFIICVHSNNTLLFSLIIAESLLGPSELGTITFCAVIFTTVINLVSICVLEYLRGNKPNIGQLLVSILTNHNMLGALVGFVFVILNIQVPELLMIPVRNISNAVLPMALIILGADLNLSSTRKNTKDLGISCFLKLVACPAIAIYVAYFLGFRGNDIITIFTMTSAPSAIICYAYAEKLDSDAPFAGELITISTLLSIITIFLWILVIPI